VRAMGDVVSLALGIVIFVALLVFVEGLRRV
jgi:hypothetical protein